MNKLNSKNNNNLMFLENKAQKTVQCLWTIFTRVI